MKLLRLVVTIALFGGLFGIFKLFFFDSVNVAQKTLSDSIQQHELELRGLERRLEAISDSNMDIEFPNNLLIEQQDKNEASLRLQDVVVDLLDSLNFETSSFAVSRKQKQTNQSTVAFEFEARTSLFDLYRFMGYLENSSPQISIADLRVRRTAIRNIDGDGKIWVTVRMTVWTFYAGTDS